MRYFITKDNGTGWQETLRPELASWGASESQYRLASRVSTGDILLHFIDYAHAWAGFSKAVSEIQESIRDDHPDWLAALPYTITIECGVWLDEGQSECTVSIPDLERTHYNRRAAFTEVQPSDAIRIIEAIKIASKENRDPSEAFHKRWTAHAESYYKSIVKSLANGRCRLCNEDVVDWSKRTGIELSETELSSVRDSFLDAAHIIADSNDGSMTPDNLRALCPSCHRVVDRLTDERRNEILNSLSVHGD